MTDINTPIDASQLPDLPTTTGPAAVAGTIKIPSKASWQEAEKAKYKPYAQDLYVAEVVEVKQVDQKVWSNGAPTDETEPALQVRFRLLRTVEGNPVNFYDNTLADKNFCTDWFKISEYAFGYNKKTGTPLKSRQFFAALQGVPAEADFSIDTEGMVGKKFKVFVEVVTTKTGDTKNKFDKFSPAK